MILPNATPRARQRFPQDHRFWLGALFLLGLALRLWGIGWGLPYLFHPDEAGKVLITLRMFQTGDLNPGYFLKPGFFLYSNALAYVPYYLGGKLLGAFATSQDLVVPTVLVMGVGKAALPSVVLVGRVLSAMCGALLALPVFHSARRLSGSKMGGLAAAFLAAVSPTSVSSSHFIHPDAHVTLCVLLTFWFALQILERGALRDYVWTGIALGLAASSKYNGGVAVLLPVGAHLLRRGWAGLRDGRLYLGLAVAGAVFLLTNPYAVLDYQHFVADVLGEFRHYQTGHAGMEGDALRYYATWLLQKEGLIAPLALLEIGRGLALRSRKHLLAAGLALPYLAFISLFAVRNERTLLPVLPILFCLAAGLLAHLAGRAREAVAGRAGRRMLVAGLAVLTLALPIAPMVQDNAALTQQDSRYVAPGWIDANLPMGARIALESYAPYVDPERYAVQGIDSMINHAPEWYVSEGVDYLVFGEGMYGRYLHDPARYPDHVARYEALFAAFRLVKTFDQGGYEIRIYAVR
ncbi:MAG: ArnT family glycosyltransferase [Anaerolineae bacterium]